MLSSLSVMRKNPAWKIFWEDEQLIASGGGDEIFLIDGINSEDGHKLFEAYSVDNFDSLKSGSPELENVLNRLLKAKILFYTATSKQGSQLKIKLFWLGAEHGELLKILIEVLQRDGEFIISNNNFDLALYIRTTGKLGDFLQTYSPDQIPHLFADLAYNHTISLGPVVFFGQTACLSCFSLRLMHSWGDAEPPSEPYILRNATLSAGIILQALKQNFGSDSAPELIETAFSFNLKNWSCQKDPVFRLPWCKVCFPENLSLKAKPYPLAWTENII
jgi:hypothetical protein